MIPRVFSGLIFSLLLAAQEDVFRVTGRVIDSSGAATPGATVTIETKHGRFRGSAATGAAGRFTLDPVGPGDYRIVAKLAGFAPASREITTGKPGSIEVELQLQPASFAHEVTVTARRIAGPPESLSPIPGSVSVLDEKEIESSRVFTIEEALRKVTGVNTRYEEGFGLRPNIGIRGLNPTRSTRVLLLEDGIPVSYAPYGDNASYYHPPVDRFESIEVVKGAGQILYGPMTVGGVVNYLTPPPPDRWSGSVLLTGGNRDYANAHVRLGGTLGGTGFLIDALRKQGEGARENVRSGLNDVNLKTLTALGSRQTLGFKLNYYGEDSNITYSGLTEAEYAANPRGNPFRNDFFYGRRIGASATYTNAFTPATVLVTNVYGAHFNRDWWRQSSNSRERPNDALCGGMLNLNTACGIQGRLRGYYNAGVEPRIRTRASWLSTVSEFDFGFRAHFENQNRQQENGTFPTARQGTLVENNVRETQAYSGFLQDRILWRQFAFTPGVRLEHVRYQRENRLSGARGATELTRWIPGIGVTWSASDRITIFTGVHRGFTPPRAEDIVTNTGGTVDLDPELSWNWEAGARARIGRTTLLEATWFRMDYENQVIPASVAGGIGATLTNAGETRHQGFELGGRLPLPRGFSLRGAYTWLAEAEFAGTRFSAIPGFGSTSVTGNRLPYAPRHLLNASVAYAHRSGVNTLLEMNYTGRQFADDLNTVNPTPDGQRGAIPGAALWNATLNVPVEGIRAAFFVTAKNLLDRTFIVDRSRGILPSFPRLVQGGVKWSF